ncbi:MAG: Ppx/GppA phosphatase family protein [Pseudomonadota bacterium]
MFTTYDAGKNRLAVFLMKSASPYFAAVDLGSNSFHMIIARVVRKRVEIIDREKEMIQLAKGINADGHLSMDAQKRAVACLRRFGERLRDIPKEQVRAVGTKTLRAIVPSRNFIKVAEAALGVPIQIVSGYEEARLIYSGLAHSVTNDHSQRLVVDIGGGSTEMIIGRDYEAQCLESLNMGCVTYSARFIGKSGKVTPTSFRKMHRAASNEIETILRPYQKTGWKIAYGTSGSIKAIGQLVADRDGGAKITRTSLQALSKDLIAGRIDLAEVPLARRDVLPAGIAILQAVFDLFELKDLHVEDAALKEGLLYDIIGRQSREDARFLTVAKLQEQYKVDIPQAERVAKTALAFWRKLGTPTLPRISRTKILTWAAQLHEIGMSISHSGHHHHGYYILRNSDLAGFGRYEQYMLASLVRSQRKGLSAADFEEFDEQTMAALTPLVLCLRLAVLLHRRREPIEPLPRLYQQDSDYQLKFKKGWLAAHPLTLAGLELERDYLDTFGVSFAYY